MSKTAKISAQEFVEIQNLYAYYNLCSDQGDAEGYASCFAEDGTLHIEPLGLTVKGARDLVAYKRKDKETRRGTYRRHWNGSLHLEKRDRKTVRGRCYFHAYNGQPGSLPVFSDAGVYEDTIVSVNGEWKFAERHLVLDGSTWTPPSVR